MKSTKQAFHWIIKLLKKHKIPYRISGELAARTYGSNRPLADIDIEIRDKDIKKLFSIAKDYVLEQPARYKDGRWDVLVLTLNYKGQKIELAGIDSQKIFDNEKKKWKSFNFGSIKKEIFEIKVNIMPKKDLIEYKSIIGRKVDLIDIKNLR